MKIAMVASEANPLCKTGGLADVIWSLSHELAEMGHEAFIVLPYYQTIKKRGELKPKRLGGYDIYLSWRKQYAEIYELKVSNVVFYLIGNDYYFNRDNLYGYDDDGERFAFFTMAARGMFGYLNIQPDIIHVHDWQVGMLPVLVREQNRFDPTFAKAHFVLTLHNEAFKGYLDRYFLSHFYGLEDRLYDEGMVRFDGQVSTLKSAIVYADKIVAVSPNHARELLEPGDSMRLHGVLAFRRADFTGIVNGVDQDEFDPENDPAIAANFSAKSLKGKKECRAKLLETMGLQDDGSPVFGLVTRLTWQKGIDLILSYGDEMLQAGAKFIALGSGEPDLENRLQQLRDRYPDRCGIYRGYSNQLAHDIYAGSDFFLMPSLFEPCGIGQMIAQRYGTLPIVRAVGGLADTVEGYDGSNEATANGFTFNDFTADALKGSCVAAMDVYKDAKLMKKLVVNAIKTDHSWRRSAELYLGIYRELVGRNR